MPLKNGQPKFAQSTAIEVSSGRGSFQPSQPIVASAPSGTTGLGASWVVSALTQATVSFKLTDIAANSTQVFSQAVTLGSDFPNPLSLLPTDTGAIVCVATYTGFNVNLLFGGISTQVEFGSVVGPNAFFPVQAWTKLTPGVSYRNGKVIVAFPVSSFTHYLGGDTVSVALAVILLGQTGTS